MAKLTREQFNKWNAQAQNGFTFDIEGYCVWNEKRLTKSIKQPDGSIIKFKIEYYPEYERKTNQWGCHWNERTGRQIPMMRIDKLIPGNTEGVYIVHTVKEKITMGEPEKTMKYSTLCRISGTVNTDEYLKEIA